MARRWRALRATRHAPESYTSDYRPQHAEVVRVALVKKMRAARMPLPSSWRRLVRATNMRSSSLRQC